ncbi:MAG TPA: hypothetical protein DIT01_20875 [Lentisphaeria bacterium]|nr:hypothetical protein [Lentisphaeria bacterium]|tara:strand:- start:2241 stop:4904 length:2664 start_codon:yes stop_codon:yes gene_type:complete
MTGRFRRCSACRPYRSVLIALAAAGICSAAQVAIARELPLAPFRYAEGFEDNDPSTFSHGSGGYTVNFKGLTTEKSHSGNSSLKLDITLGGTEVNWKIPVRVPIEGSLTLTGHLALGEQTTGDGRANIEATIRTEPAVTRPGFGFGDTAVTREHAGWKRIEGNLVTFGKDWANRAQRVFVWESSGDDVGAWLTNLSIRINGNKGDRVVVYVDDLVIEGQVPADADFQQEIQRRWTAAGQRVTDKVAEWETALGKASERIEAIARTSSKMVGELNEARDSLASLHGELKQIRDAGHIRKQHHSSVEAALVKLNFTIENVQAKSMKAGMLGGRILCYQTKPTSGAMILPDTDPIPGRLTNDLSVAAAAGTYEPVSLVLRALTDVTALELAVSDLESEAGVVAAGNVDIKVVKCWYQAKGAWHWKSRKGPGKVLVPELLLNDDTLVRVDMAEQKNYLKLRFPDGDRYTWLDDPKEGWTPRMGQHGPVIRHQIADFPVRDSPQLLPVDIAANTNKQFWITVKIPDETRPGTYRGQLKLADPDGALGSMGLTVEVLPFKLAAPGTNYDPAEPFTLCIYYDGRFDARYPNVIADYKNEAQLRSDLANFFAHGVNPTVNQAFDRELLGKYLQLRNDVGFRGAPIYFNGNPGVSTGNPTTREALAALKKTVREVIAFAKSYEVPEVYLYGMDEAVAERLKSQRAAWQAVHEAGGKVWVAGSAGTFEAMGDLLDILNFGASRTGPDPDEPAKWHGAGHKIWNYGNPQGGVENPELYRRNYGVLLWKMNYDGGGPWAWQSEAFGGVWNDFNCNRRAVGMTYPTTDGCIDTIAWEGFREAVDDVRYATTLRLAIEKAGANANHKVVATEAAAYLDKFDVTGDLDEIRKTIVNYILKLQ